MKKQQTMPSAKNSLPSFVESVLVSGEQRMSEWPEPFLEAYLGDSRLVYVSSAIELERRMSCLWRAMGVRSSRAVIKGQVNQSGTEEGRVIALFSFLLLSFDSNPRRLLMPVDSILRKQR